MGAEARRLSLAFVLPYGEPNEGFFPDGLMEHLCALAQDRGHDARLLRVYYHGRDAAQDSDVRARLTRWLDDRDVDLVVVERLFDPAPVREAVARRNGRAAVLLSWGDSDVMEGIDWIVGRTPGLARGGTTRRSPSAGELARSFVGLLDALSKGSDATGVHGVARVEGSTLRGTPSPSDAPLQRPFRAVIEHDVIAPGAVPRLTRKYLFGNAGCPFALDPMGRPHFAKVSLPIDGQLSRLGCAFCHAGGDYQKREDAEVIDELLDQASFYLQHLPDLEELVLVDQHAIRFLAPLLREATARGLRPVRWLFSARADAWIREETRMRAVLQAAHEGGHVVELYLSGFEALCDRELERYNKGVTVAELLQAVDAMRARRSADPEVFEYARAKGHSLILWNPWTQVDDLAETVQHVRGHGLLELFHDLGKNRLRLYPDIPITYAAERDGALVDEWQDADEGGARRKGYAVERPWRFLDPRTRLAHALARALRDRLGPETELPQLSAIVKAVAAWGPIVDAEVPARVASIVSELTLLEQALPPPPPGARARVVHFAGACNNGCATCANHDTWLPDDAESLRRRIDDARAQGPQPIVLAGREPTLHPELMSLISHAKGHDGRAVGIVTNGRRFAYPAFARSAVAAGLVAASIKLFAPHDEIADAIARVPGAHRQALSGIDELRAAGLNALEIRAPLHRDNLSTLDAYAAVAAERGVRLHLEVGLDAVGLDRLAEATTALRRLTTACAARRVRLSASTLSSGTRAFEVLPER